MIHPFKYNLSRELHDRILDGVEQPFRTLVLNRVCNIIRIKVNENVYREVMMTTQDYHEY